MPLTGAPARLVVLLAVVPLVPLTGAPDKAGGAPGKPVVPQAPGERVMTHVPTWIRPCL